MTTWEIVLRSHIRLLAGKSKSIRQTASRLSRRGPQLFHYFTPFRWLRLKQPTTGREFTRNQIRFGNPKSLKGILMHEEYEV